VGQCQASINRQITVATMGWGILWSNGWDSEALAASDVFNYVSAQHLIADRIRCPPSSSFVPPAACPLMWSGIVRSLIMYDVFSAKIPYNVWSGKIAIILSLIMYGTFWVMLFCIPYNVWQISVDPAAVQAMLVMFQHLYLTSGWLGHNNSVVQEKEGNGGGG